MSDFAYPVDIKQLEKEFGPYFEGANHDDATKTVSAVQQITRGNRRGQYLGVVGVHPNAHFHVQFPEPVDLSGFKVTRKGKKLPVDSITGLTREGPQGDQHRMQEVEAWHEARRLAKLSGEHAARLVLDGVGVEVAVRVVIKGKPPKQQIAFKPRTKVWLRDASRRG